MERWPSIIDPEKLAHELKNIPPHRFADVSLDRHEAARRISDTLRIGFLCTPDDFYVVLPAPNKVQQVKDRDKLSKNIKKRADHRLHLQFPELFYQEQKAEEQKEPPPNQNQESNKEDDINDDKEAGNKKDNEDMHSADPDISELDSEE